MNSESHNLVQIAALNFKILNFLKVYFLQKKYNLAQGCKSTGLYDLSYESSTELACGMHSRFGVWAGASTADTA